MEEALASKNKSLVTKLLLIVVGMFVFATLILPPLYDVFCDITGLNGKVALTPAKPAEASQANTNDPEAILGRTINVEFTTKVHKGMPWSFTKETSSIQVEPGKSNLVYFEVHNPTDKDMVGRAVPSISPASAAKYVEKMECFCFQEQPLAAGETKRMPLNFYLDADTPEHVEELTMSYTLYNKES